MKRRVANFAWYQVRLRTLLVFITLIAAICAIWAANIAPYVAQWKVSSKMIADGAQCEFRAGQKWLRPFLGDEVCREAISVRLAGEAVSPEMLAATENLPWIRTLILQGEHVEDKTLEQIRPSESLTGIVLDSTLVSSAAMDEFRQRNPSVTLHRSDEEIIRTIAVNSPYVRLETKVFDDPPAWLIRAVGEGSLKEILAVNSVPGDWSAFRAAEFRMLARCQRLRSLEFENVLTRIPQFSDESGRYQRVVQQHNAELAPLLDLTQLQRLSIYLADPSWAHNLAKLQNLEELIIHGYDDYRLKDEEIVPLLKQLPKLRSFGAPGAVVKQLDAWPQLPLSRLNISHSSVNDADMAVLVEKFPELKSLDLQATEVTDAGLAVLHRLPQLESLLLAENRVTPQSWEVLQQYAELKEISVGLGRTPQRPLSRPLHLFEDHEQAFEVDILPRPIASLAAPTAERIAEIRSGLASGDAFAADPSDVRLTPAQSLHLDALGEFPNVIIAKLWDTYLDDDGVLEIVRAFPNLESLDVSNTWITDEGLAHLASLANLRQLSLGGTRITSVGLNSLSGLSNLQFLELPSSLDDASVDSLLTFPSLRLVKFDQPEDSRRDYDAQPITSPRVAAWKRLSTALVAQADKDGNGMLQGSEVPSAPQMGVYPILRIEGTDGMLNYLFGKQLLQ